MQPTPSRSPSHSNPTRTASAVSTPSSSPSAGAASPAGASGGAPATHGLTLDALAARSFAELDATYRRASVSASMHATDGALVGRMLAVRGVPGPLAAPLRRWAASSSFLWEGKTFRAQEERSGRGHNRVYVPRALGRQDLFPFATSFGASAIDGQPTLILDYDLDANPGYIRHVHDEIREVTPGLFLGPAMWKSVVGKRATADGAKTLLLWFALDARCS